MRFVALYTPASFVVRVLVTCVSMLITRTVAPGRTAPLESLTVLAVIGASRRQRRGAEDVRQVPMFGE